MRSSWLLVIRALFVLALLCMMPLLALPPVGPWIEGRWRALLESNTAAVGPQAGGQRQVTVRTGPLASGRGLVVPSTAADDRLRSIHRRLRELGVTYTKLESGGSAAGVYRFECQIPVNSSVYARTFEGTAADPVWAMERVLAQVESWHRSRQHLKKPSQRPWLAVP